MPARTSRDPAAVAFGAAVRAAREARGVSIEIVARDIPRMDAAYLAAIERGWHAVTIVTAKRIAVALEVPLAELVRDVWADRRRRSRRPPRRSGSRSGASGRRWRGTVRHARG